MLLAHLLVTSLAVQPPTRIAVVGGGLAGLSTAAHLLADTPLQTLHIYDAALPGEGGASAVAAGLLHPFTPRGREIWCGTQGFDATVALIQRVEAVYGKHFSRATGLLRLGLSDEKASELQDVVASSAEHSGGHAAMEQAWLSQEAACTHAGATVGGLGASHAPAALCVDVPAYLRGLWHLCEESMRSSAQSSSSSSSSSAAANAVETSVEWRLEKLSSLAPLIESAQYDAIIVALGARATSIDGLQDLPLRGCRGQNLVLRNGGGWQTPIISGKYVVPIDGGERLLAGATFEYDATSTALHRPADEAFAESELRAPLERLCPGIGDEELLSVQAGVRALPPRSHHGYVPIAGRLGGSSQRGAPSTECWLIGGLGSRGLIHHALIGRDLARAVLARDESLLPPHVRRAQDALDAARL